MKKLIYIFSLIFFIEAIISCRPARKVHTIENAISKIDTSQTFLVPGKVVDSLTLVKEIIGNLNKIQHIDYQTFSAKIKVDYEGKDDNGNVTVYLRMQKDSLIWASLRGPLGIEGFRILIDRKHVKVLDLLKHTVQFRNVSYLQEITNIPLDFNQLQDILIGNPVFIDSNIVSYKSNQNQLLVLMVGKIFKNLLTLDKTSLLVEHSKLDDANPARNRTCDLTYDDYEVVDKFHFPTSRKISVAERSKLDVNLEFKQYNFNQAETFPFNIPKNYKVL